MQTVLRDRSEREVDRYGPRALLFPDQLRPMETVLEVTAPGSVLPVGAFALFVGHYQGSAIVVDLDAACLKRVVVVPAHVLDWPVLPVDPLDMDYLDFMEGYTLGVTTSELGNEIGTLSKKRTPTWFGRGVREGFADREDGTSIRFGWGIAEKRAFARAFFRALPYERPPLQLGGVA